MVLKQGLRGIWGYLGGIWGYLGALGGTWGHLGPRAWLAPLVVMNAKKSGLRKSSQRGNHAVQTDAVQDFMDEFLGNKGNEKERQQARLIVEPPHAPRMCN